MSAIQDCVKCTVFFLSLTVCFGSLIGTLPAGNKTCRRRYSRVCVYARFWCALPSVLFPRRFSRRKHNQTQTFIQQHGRSGTFVGVSLLFHYVENKLLPDGHPALLLSICVTEPGAASRRASHLTLHRAREATPSAAEARSSACSSITMRQFGMYHAEVFALVRRGRYPANLRHFIPVRCVGDVPNSLHGLCAVVGLKRSNCEERR